MYILKLEPYEKTDFFIFDLCKEKKFNLIEVSVGTYDFKSPKWQQTRNISENGFLKTVLRLSSPLQNLMPHIWALKVLAISVDADPDPIFYCDADPDPIFYCDADPDTACPFDADPEPIFYFDADLDPSYQKKAQSLCSKKLIFHTFWLVICKTDEDLDPAYHFDGDPDPDPQHCLKVQLDLICWKKQLSVVFAV
jgi:hypothetical protein